jgi:inorganic pyrophosphatase
MSHSQSPPSTRPILKTRSSLSAAHPWHGVPIGDEMPGTINCFIELVPNDTVKFELEKFSGILKVDRPQLYSNRCPMPYGLVPQTICAARVAARCNEVVNRSDIIGDMDPMDVCVISEQNIPNGNILLTARVIGGLRMIDRAEADDKIIAVLKDDPAYVHWQDLRDCPRNFIDRLKHYFLTYKQQPGKGSPCEIAEEYGAEEARQMIHLAHQDYLDKFGDLAAILRNTMRLD